MGDRETAADGVRQVTYLFTDIEGSTSLWQEQPEAMAAALARHFEVLRAAVTAAGGEVVQDTGDGIFAVFDTAATAVRGAIGIQRGLRDATWGSTGPLKVRVGLHTGTVDPTLEDYRGTSVNRAARVMDVAHGEQVVCSGTTRELLRDTPLGEVELVDLGSHTLRGLAAAEHLWQVSAPDLRSDFPPPRVKGGAVSAVCPYKGLAAFQPEDAELFFGREELVDRLLARFASSRFLAVVGPSGSGKSSAVRAGLLPALARGGLPGSGAWMPLVFTPTAEPVEELAHRLALSSASSLSTVAADLAHSARGIDTHVKAVLASTRPDAQLLLVVDQFEELFTLCRDEATRAAFVELLLRLATAEGLRARVVVSLRADHYGSCASFPELAALLSSTHVLVGPMDDRELRRAVTGPAEAVGLELEPALVDAVVADTGGGAGSLPLLSHALVETWARRSAATLTLDGYRQAGGVEGAIARTAESLYRDRLDAEQRDIARLIFLRLVEPGQDAPDSKRRAALEDLIPTGHDETTVRAVLDEVIDARLVTTDESSLELAHEALLREWPTLRRWLDDNREGLRLLRHLNEAAHAWDDLDRDEGELYRGARLAAVIEWLDTSDVDLNPTEQAFVEASVDLAEAQERRAAERAARQARQNRRLRLLTAGLGVGLVLALAAGTYALVAERREAATAEAAQADALAFSAVNELQEDAERASLLAAEAYAVQPDLESQGALLDVLDVDPRIISLRPLPDDTCFERTGTGEVTLHSTLTTEGQVFEVRTLDQEVLRSMPIQDEGAFCSLLTPSGEHIIDRTSDGYVVRDAETLDVVARRDDVYFAGDQRHLDVHPTRDEAVVVLDRGRPAIVAVPSLETMQLLEVDLGGRQDETPDSTAGEGRQGVTPDSTAGEDTSGPTLDRAVIYSEDASLIAVADDDTVQVVTSGGDVAATVGAEPHPNGRVYPFVSAGAEVAGYLGARELHVADLSAPGQVDTIELDAATTPYRRGVAVEPGGRRLAVATEQGIVVVDLVGRAVEGTPLPVDAGIADLFWSAEGRLNSQGPNGVFQFDVDRGFLLGETAYDGDLPAGETSVASDGSGVVSNGDEGWYVDVDTGAEYELYGSDDTAHAAPLPGGRWLLVDLQDGTVSIGDAGGVVTELVVSGMGTDRHSVIGVDVEGQRAGVAITVPDTSSLGLVVDTETGEVLARHESPADDLITTVTPLGDGFTVLGHQSYEWVAVQHDGTVVDGPRTLGVGYELAASGPDGDRYVTADFNGDLHVVLPEADDVVDLVGPASRVLAAAFVDGDRLVSRHADGSTYLWDIPEARLVGRLWRSAAATDHGIAVDREANELLQATGDGLVRIPLDPDTWLSAVCRRVSRSLDPVEIAAVAPGRTSLEPCATSATAVGAMR